VLVVYILRATVDFKLPLEEQFKEEDLDAYDPFETPEATPDELFKLMKSLLKNEDTDVQERSDWIKKRKEAEEQDKIRKGFEVDRAKFNLIET